MAGDLKPGDVTTLGALRPGDVGEFHVINDPTPFVLTVDSEGRSRCEWADGSWQWFSPEIPVVYRGRGKIVPAVPARIVLDCEQDRVAELEAQVRTLREACTAVVYDNHTYTEAFKLCEAALTATAPKGEPCTT